MSKKRARVSPPHLAIATALICLPVLGCQPAMSNSKPGSAGEIVRNEFPLRFTKHNFSAHCYGTIGCSVIYYDTYQAKTEADEISPPPSSPDYKKNWGGASHIGIPNFPSPVEVAWKSMDGTAHEALVDLGEIFKDRLILHNVPQENIPVETAATIGGPDIFLEVNDRTINVYMEAAIALKDNATRRSDFRSDLILAWSHTY